MPKRPLPESAQVIADIIGREATLALAATTSHRCLYVPKGQLKDNHLIPRTIGKDRTAKLQVHFAGLLLPLANCAEIHREERNESIVAGHRAGKTSRQLAELWGITVRCVEQVIAQEKKGR